MEKFCINHTKEDKKFVFFIKWLVGRLFFAFVIIIVVICFADKYHKNDSVFLEASGTKSKLEKIIYLKNAIRYEVRAFNNRSGSQNIMIPLERKYGKINGVHKDGMIEYEYYENESIVKKKSELANLEITNIYDLAKQVNEISSKKAVFDIYQNGDILIWMQGQPLNLLFINSGLANPHPKPFTNMVDRLFAEHYWRLFFKNTN